MKWLLGSIAALLMLMLVLQWEGWNEKSSLNILEVNETQNKDEGLASLPNAADLLTPPAPKEEYVSLIERPLFLPDRRLPEQQSDEELGEEPEPVDDSGLRGLDFNAVMITNGVRVAWIRSPSSPNLLRLYEGDEFNGWVVTEIQDDRLLLSAQNVEKQFILRDYANAPRPIPPTRLPRSSAAPPSPGSTDEPSERPTSEVANKTDQERPSTHLDKSLQKADEDAASPGVLARPATRSDSRNIPKEPVFGPSR